MKSFKEAIFRGEMSSVESIETQIACRLKKQLTWKNSISLRIVQTHLWHIDNGMVIQRLKMY